MPFIIPPKNAMWTSAVFQHATFCMLRSELASWRMLSSVNLLHFFRYLRFVIPKSKLIVEHIPQLARRLVCCPESQNDCTKFIKKTQVYFTTCRCLLLCTFLHCHRVVFTIYAQLRNSNRERQKPKILHVSSQVTSYLPVQHIRL